MPEDIDKLFDNTKNWCKFSISAFWRKDLGKKG